LVNPRKLAINILTKTQEGAYSNLLLNHYLDSDIVQKDRALVTELVNGVLQNKKHLDHIIFQFSRIAPSKIAPFVKNALRIAVYQVFFLDKIPDFAAVNESVNLVKQHKDKKTANFTNAVLRNVIRNKAKISFPSREKNIKQYLSVYYSFPEWLIIRWLELFGKDFTEKLCIALNERSKLCIRLNTLIATKEEIIKKLSSEGVSMSPGFLVDEAWYVVDSPPLRQLKSFYDGLFTPQDESSILASIALGVKSNDNVLDVAAAPGGKSTHMAALMKNQGRIIAWDIHSHRIELIKKNCQRLKVNIIEPKIKDAMMLHEEEFGKYDKVMIDAPCSGLGVIRRKPDIKWTKKPEDIDTLKIQQQKILETCSNYVKPGGFLLYSTCSIDPEENEKIVEKFINNNNNFTYDDLRPYLPEKLHRDLSEHCGYITLYPNIHGTDGFFIARLKKVKT